VQLPERQSPPTEHVIPVAFLHTPELQVAEPVLTEHWKSDVQGCCGLRRHVPDEQYSLPASLQSELLVQAWEPHTLLGWVDCWKHERGRTHSLFVEHGAKMLPWQVPW
jgi:hypothetical protein